MGSTISSKADMSSALYEGRANFSEIADILAMQDKTWRDRLVAAMDERGLSWRKVSLAAGMGKGYVFSILSEGKDPTIDNLSAVCRAAGVSLPFVLYGIDLSPDNEELLVALGKADDDDRNALLTLLRKRRLSETPTLPDDHPNPAD